ncbi:MAG: Nitrogen regulatory protein P-II [Candidatus Omnitrophica bacterium]|nr:Nitrogen regulatory protein P-II [Candidatus Omnitrophota bacterium]
MKRIDAVIRREQFAAVKKALDRCGSPGLMVFTLRGHGRQRGVYEKFNGRRFKVELVPKILLTIFADDPDAERIVDTVRRTARTGRVGDGKIFVAALEQAVRIRTGETGGAAL